MRPELWVEGLKGKNPLHFGGRCVDTEKMTLHVWCWWERGSADSYLNSFPCRSTAQNQSHRRQMHWDESDPLPTGPPEKCLSKKNSVSYWNVWLLQGVKCSLHHWKHLPALGWFQYQTAAAAGEKHHVTHWIHAWLGFYLRFIQWMMRNVIRICKNIMLMTQLSSQTS